MTRVTHQPRVAWDGAMMFVGTARFDDLHGWLAPLLGDLLGPDAVRALAETRYQLRYSARPDIRQIETGRWRVRLAHLLEQDPALAGPLADLNHETHIRLRELVPPFRPDRGSRTAPG